MNRLNLSDKVPSKCCGYLSARWITCPPETPLRSYAVGGLGDTIQNDKCVDQCYCDETTSWLSRSPNPIDQILSTTRADNQVVNMALTGCITNISLFNVCMKSLPSKFIAAKLVQKFVGRYQDGSSCRSYSKQ